MKHLKQIKTQDYVCNYIFCDGQKVFVFLNGTIGVKEFFSNFKKYKDKNDGYLFIDLPGFGSSAISSKTKKSVIKMHVEAIYKIILKEKINNFFLILFSLSTVYLVIMEKILFFQKNIKKIIFIDPTLFPRDLVWSKKISLMRKREYLEYIKFYKKNLSVIFHAFLFTKKKYMNICNNLKRFYNLVLYRFNKECVHIVKNKNLLSNFKKTEKYFIFPDVEKNKILFKKFKNISLLKKCGHYVFLDQPKKTFNLIKKYAK